MDEFDKKRKSQKNTVFQIAWIHLECLWRYATSIEINVEKKDCRMLNNRFDRVPYDF